MMRRLLVLLCGFISINVSGQEEYSMAGDALRITFVHESIINEELMIKLLLDSAIQNCKSVTINGSFNKFPNNFFQLNWIENIDISSDLAIEFPANFSSFKKLKTLIVFSEVKKISSKIIFQNIESVQFLNANFKKFPISVCHWLSLEDLDIQNCSFKTVPSFIGLLKNLKRLNLSTNGINILPDEFYTLMNLRSLGLANNQLGDLSIMICDMHKLEEIYLDNNKLILSSGILECLKDKIVTLE